MREYKTLLIGMISVLCMITSPVQAQIPAEHVTQLNVVGVVNDVQFTGSGVATYSSDLPSRITNDIIYSGLPPSFTGDIIVTIINTWKCTGRPSSINIDQVTGGAFAMVRTINVRDAATQTFYGQITIEGELSTLPGLNRSIANLSISGEYSGPVDIVSVSGYLQLLKQDGPRVIRGSYLQNLFTSDGRTLDLIVDTKWTYNSPNQLPEDEFSILKIDSHSFDMSTGRLLLSGTGFYTLAREVPGHE